MTVVLEWDKAAQWVHDAERVLVLSHINPDGDAFGSMLGLAAALKLLGKRVSTAIDGGVLPEFRFLPGADAVQPSLERADVDLVIAVDCGDESRMGQVGHVARQSGAPLINLDHHRTNTLFGDANLVDPRTVAAAEGVLNWLDRMGAALDYDAAYCLLTGLVTDTQCFRTSNVTGTTLEKARRLMTYGPSLSEIVYRTVNRRPFAALRLWAEALQTVQLADGVIWAVLTRAMYERAGYDCCDDAGLVSQLVQADEAAISVVFRENGNGGVEIGIRSVPGCDVSDVAVALGGGGHPQAAGATVRGEALETLVPRVVGMLQDVVRQSAPTV